jgi:thiol:disulfide interchange protein DsbC
MRSYWFAAAALVALSSSAPAAGDPAAEQKVRDALKGFAPGVQIDSVAPAQIPGFYEVVTQGHVAYVSADGKYLVRGEVVEMASKRELTAERVGALRKVALDAVPDNKHIVFSAKEPKHSITVFTDIDCGYCRKLHSQIADYNDRGITVKYLFFPRAGLASDSYKKAVSVWCAADRGKALTEAKSGKDPEMKTCDNPVTEEFQLGVKVGVSGTPAIFADSGTQIGGYLTPDQMASRLDAMDAPQSKSTAAK